MLLSSSSKKFVRLFLTQKVPFAVTSSRRNCANWSEVLNESLPARKSYRDFQTLDGCQRDALDASLDNSKSMVTVLGTPGTGKTLLVTEVAHLMQTRKQRALVVCGSREILYSTVGRYFRRAKSIEHFVHLQPFDETVAHRIAPDIRRYVYAHHPAVREALAKRSLVAMLGKQKAKGNGTTMGMVEVLQSEAARDKTMLVFATPDDVFALLEHLPINKEDLSSSSPLFDAVILEDVGALKGSDDWRAFLQLAPLLRVFSDPHHSIALPPSDPSSSSESEETPFQCSVVQQIQPNEDESPVFVLRRQFRGNMNIQIWTGRAFYAPLHNEISLARPAPYSQHELRMNHLMDRLVLDEQSVYTDSLTLVDTGALDGHWTEAMFQPSEMVEWADGSAAPSPVNWGEALLSAAHINALLRYGIWPYQVACFTHSSAQKEAIRRILFYLNDDSLLSSATSKGCVEIGRVEQYLGRPFESIVKSFISDDAFAASFRSQRALHYFSAEMTAANRQIFMITPMRRFRQLRMKESYYFITLFTTRGTIITPSELFPLQKGQFEEIVRKAKAANGNSTADVFTDATNNKNRKAELRSA